jgi:ACT domain-containing protein
LRASGFRTTSESHHYRTIQSLYLTLEIESRKGNIVERLDAFRLKRAKTTYEIAGAVTEADVQELIELVKKLKRMIVDWLQLNHPELD